MEPEAVTAKVDFPTIAMKKKTAAAMIRALEERDGFLLVGHRNPDEDCVAAMVAFGLLAVKLNKAVYLSISGNVNAQFGYLLKICTYNSIIVLVDGALPPGPVGAVVALDTPKPDMLEMSPAIRALIESERPLKMEIDHHIGADSTFFGDEGFRLVATASSASELVGYLALKMDGDEAFKTRCQVGEVLSRNLVLAVLTGIIGDSRMGKYLKTRRERWFYELFSSRFDSLLAQKTRKGTGNFTSKEEVFDAIASLSSEEQKCFELMMKRRRRSPSVAYVLLDAEEVSRIRDAHGDEIMTAVAKSVADALAEESGLLGLLAYPDHPELSGFVQFRVRRCHSFRGLDLREMLDRLSITNGGGHPGAVGFRFPTEEVPDLEPFAARLIDRIEGLVREAASRAI
jgi:nanoRNase/pAp phosphatase (c-di-AMP/oligoRNAs hydrolase)